MIVLTVHILNDFQQVGTLKAFGEIEMNF